MTVRVAASSTIPIWIVAVLASLFSLRAARPLLIPIALAVLISYALEPMVAWLERHRVPRLAASPLVLIVTLAAVGTGAYALRNDAIELLQALPQAMDRLREMVLSQLGVGADVVKEVMGNSGGSSGPVGEGATGSGQTQGPFLQRGVTAVFALAGHLVVIVFLILFLLISGRHIRDRLVEIVGRDTELRRTTAAILDEINAQVQRYLLVLLFTAVIVGAATGLVLAVIGVRHAAMWGILAGLFNSIPYFGPVVVSGGLFVVGLVQGGGMTAALQMSGAAIVITSLEGWLLTPALMGKAERMSALAVFLGLLLWTWIWGAWGTILAVPMLVVIKSVADRVERLKPLGRLMAP